MQAIDMDSQIEWYIRNTSKTEINVVKLANIDSINSVNKITCYKI